MSFLSKLFGSSKAPSTQHSTDNSISIESSVTLTSRYVEVKQRTKGLLPSIVLEACIPDGACSLDVSAIISRITDKDEKPVSTKLACHAQKYGLKFSRYHGRTAILNIAESSLSAMEYSNFVLSLK